MAKTKKHELAKWILAADLGGISAVLMFLEFNVPFIPSFLKLDFSDLAVVLGGLIIGPLQGAFIALVKVTIHLFLKGSATGGVGELANVINSLCYMLTTVFIYKKTRTRLGGHTGLIAGTVMTSIVATVVNYFVIFPIYQLRMGYSAEELISLSANVNPYITSLGGLAIAAVLPFNVFKYIIISLMTGLLYRRLNLFVRKYIY